MHRVFIKYSAHPTIIHGVDNSWSIGYEMFKIAFVPVRGKIEDCFLCFYSENYMNSACSWWRPAATLVQYVL